MRDRNVVENDEDEDDDCRACDGDGVDRFGFDCTTCFGTGKIENE
jgi:DnaJ-class molecular chaperone